MPSKGRFLMYIETVLVLNDDVEEKSKKTILTLYYNDEFMQ